MQVSVFTQYSITYPATLQYRDSRIGCKFERIILGVIKFAPLKQ
jgi:hypothetical protein